MLSNQAIEKKLLESVGLKDDPQEQSKISEIKHWCLSYGELLENNVDKQFNFIVGVFKEKNSWKHPQFSEGGDQPVTLDRNKVFKALSDSEYMVNSENNPFPHELRYQIACWGCLNNGYIKKMFEEIFVKRYGIDENKEDYKEKLCDLVAGWFPSPLASFWSHLIYREGSPISDWVENEFSDKRFSKFEGLAKKYKDLDEEKYYAIGFEYAASEGKADAMKFFINKVSKADKRKKMLIDTAVNPKANFVAIDFCLKELKPDNHMKLLLEDYKKNKHSAILQNMIYKNNFLYAQNLLSSWSFNIVEDQEVKCEFGKDYSYMIFGILDNMISLSDDLPKQKEADDLLHTVLSNPNFTQYKNSFIENMVNEKTSPFRKRIASLIIKDNNSKALSFILESANPEQFSSLINSTEFSLVPFFLKDLKNSDISSKLKNSGMSEPNYDEISKSLEQSMASTSSEKSSPFKGNILASSSKSLGMDLTKDNRSEDSNF